ncbi:MAG: elongation factor Ts [Clostridia bacterium]|nr:elongation factor Ts [Clostridia bacterium]
MAFTAQDVKTLRERTGVGMMDCKKALTEADGDMDKAIDLLRERGLAAAAKKAGRIAAEGVVYAEADLSKKVGVIVEVNSETDFVAKNADFQAFVKDVAGVIMDKAPTSVDELLTLPMGEGDVAAALRDKILVIGENLSIRRFERFEGDCVAYIHDHGRLAALVKFDVAAGVDPAALTACGIDVAQQIVSMNPDYLDAAAIPAEDIEKEKEIQIAKAKNDPKSANKPDEIIVKMVEGRMGKFFEERCLLSQVFVKGDGITVGQYVENCAKAAGDMKVVAFVRYEKGEGLQKREDDFAAEVASMVK